MRNSLIRVTLLSLFFLLPSDVLSADEIKLKTHKIYFLGDTFFEAAYIEDALGIERASKWRFWKPQYSTIKAKLIPSLEASLKSFYTSEGFYNALIDIEKNRTTVKVTIEANQPIRVNSITISSDYNISELVTFKKKKIFKAKQFIEIKNSIIDSLNKEGYCSYDLDNKAYVDIVKHEVDIVYNLKRGEVCTFGKLEIKGLKTIDESIIKSRVEALEGARFNSELVNSTSNNLYGLTSFDRVIINVNKKFYNVVPVEIELTEIEKPYHAEVGAGYDTFVGTKVHAEVTKHNFLGNAQKLKFRSSWSQREQLIELSFFKPSFINLYDYSFDLGSKIGYGNLEFDGFKEKKSYIGNYLNYKSRNVKLRLGVSLEYIDITALDNLDFFADVTEGNFVLFYPYWEYVYDGRDSKLNPHYGYYFSSYQEFGLSFDERGSVYIKTILEGRGIYSLGDLTMALTLKGGTIDISGENGVPESKLFFGGGAYSNRAYGFNELGFILSPTEDINSGALSMANLSLEFNYPIIGELYGAVFSDKTMLTGDSYDFKGEVITSGGLGVRYITPIGPFKLDVGFNTKDSSQYGISFQIGQSF